MSPDICKNSNSQKQLDTKEARLLHQTSHMSSRKNLAIPPHAKTKLTASDQRLAKKRQTPEKQESGPLAKRAAAAAAAWGKTVSIARKPTSAHAHAQ